MIPSGRLDTIGRVQESKDGASQAHHQGLLLSLHKQADPGLSSFAVWGNWVHGALRLS